jgi:hypothetical protein
MTDRIEYEMTDEDWEFMLDAMKPQPLIMLQCGPTPSPQQRANEAWWELGRKRGFDGGTARPCPGKGPRFFTAVPVSAPEGTEVFGGVMQ